MVNILILENCVRYNVSVNNNTIFKIVAENFNVTQDLLVLYNLFNDKFEFVVAFPIINLVL